MRRQFGFPGALEFLLLFVSDCRTIGVEKAGGFLNRHPYTAEAAVTVEIFAVVAELADAPA